MPKKKKTKKAKKSKIVKKVKVLNKAKSSLKAQDKKNNTPGPDEKPEIKKIKKQATEKKIYNLKDLTSDINLILKKNIKLINLVTEPIKVREIASYCFNVDFNNYTEGKPDNYNISSKYRDFYRTKTDILNQIRHFIKSTD